MLCLIFKEENQGESRKESLPCPQESLERVRGHARLKCFLFLEFQEVED